MSKLPYISDRDLYIHVETVINKAKKAAELSEEKFYKNSVDPFSALFDALWKDISVSKWIEQEKSRQIQKTLQNALGDFHQNILGSSKGWENLTTGNVFDIKNEDIKIIAEIKNKHNTTKGNHKVAIYDDLKEQLDGEYNGYIAYYVEVIPKNKKVYNKLFTPPDNRTHSRRPDNESIRVIDGKSFYALATKDEDALLKLYKILPSVITEVLGRGKNKTFEDKEFMDLFNKVY